MTPIRKSKTIIIIDNPKLSTSIRLIDVEFFANVIVVNFNSGKRKRKSKLK